MSPPLSILHCDFRLTWAGGQNQLWLLASGLRDRGHRQWIVTRPQSEMARRARGAGRAGQDARLVVHAPLLSESGERYGRGARWFQAGGAGSAVCEVLNGKTKVLLLGLPDRFIDHGDHQAADGGGST